MKKTMILLCAALLALPATAQNSIWSYPALGAAPATDDKLFLYDTSATASKTITINNLFTSPTLVTPTLGAATATTLNKITITAPATGATLTIPDGVVFTGPSTTGTAATLAGTETLTNKTITSAVLGTGLTASGSASNDFSGSTGTFKTSTGLTTISGGVTGAVQALSGAGAVNLTTVSTHWTTTGADAGTLADGTAGQIKVVIMKVDGGTGTLTPTTASGFTSVVFDDPGDAVTLEFVASIGWVVIGSRGVTF